MLLLGRKLGNRFTWYVALAASDSCDASGSVRWVNAPAHPLGSAGDVGVCGTAAANVNENTGGEITGESASPLSILRE